jgi:uncharacterized protein (DUF58 family)
MGVRDYSHRDSLRRIHWKVSARHNELKVKVFEPTTTLDVAMFLSVDSFNTEDTKDDNDFELGISTAASLTRYLLDAGNPVGMFVNTQQADSDQPVRINAGCTVSQNVQILEALAKVTAKVSGPFEDFLQNERRSLPWGTTLIIVISEVTGSLIALLASMKESGYKLIVLQIGDHDQEEHARKFAWHVIKEPADLTNIGMEAPV